jgi:ATP-dependent exoDNAse (exonuclease V) beta subunit
MSKQTGLNMDFTWSFSSLKDYTNCPRQYHEVKVLKRFYKATTQEMTYGNAVHKICEDYVNEGKPLDKNNAQFKPLLDTLVDIEGTKHAELRLAMNKKGEACKYSADDVWVRGIVDLVIIDGDTAFIVDYKTGSTKYPEPKQLKLMALMTFAHYPEVMRIKAALLFIVHNGFVNEEYTRDDVEDLWATFHPDLQRLESSYSTGVWNPNSTPLCGWCPVKTCEHHKVRR